ncbi:MAG: ATP-binding protein [Ignavibacteriaceae bacterium]|nr:ATP-binding protein [Ignavibacteriaceae bacterium]
MKTQNYHLEIKSDPNNLIIVEEFFNQIAVEINLPEKRFPELMVALTEAITNAIIHANKKDPSKMVYIDFIVEDKMLTIKVKDEGNGFDPSIIPDPTQPENLFRDSGRGVYLMKVYCDEVYHNITPTGTETVLKISF